MSNCIFYPICDDCRHNGACTDPLELESFGHEAYCELEPCTSCPANGCSRRQAQRIEDTEIPASWGNTPYSHCNPIMQPAVFGPYVEHITIHDVEWYQPAF